MHSAPRLIADRYALTSHIAGGGMGQVWRGHDTLLDRPVAVKLLRDDLAGDPGFLARFRAEAQHAAVLTHPHIAAVFDYGETRSGSGGPPLAYLVMELVEGESLAALLARQPRLDAARTLGVVRQAADGLAAAHAAGVVHRDVKPANLLVRDDGVVKITDFGIARSASVVSVTVTGQVMGTAHYLSPEQASGQPAGPASDVYALGLVAYECLAGRRAFEGENAVQVAVRQIRENPAPLPADVPAGVRALVEAATVKDPAARFPDGAALRDAVDRLIAGAPTTPVRPGSTAVLPLPGPTAAVPVAVAAPSARRRFVLPALAGLVALLIAVTVLVAALTGPTTPTDAAHVPASSTTPAGIAVVAEEHVGRPVAQVQAALIGLGLQVELVPVETADVPAGQVMAVEPAGQLTPGDVVRLSYAVPPVPIPAPPPVAEDGGNGNGHDNGHGNDNSNGNGHGKGNGHGNGDGNRGGGGWDGDDG